MRDYVYFRKTDKHARVALRINYHGLFTFDVAIIVDRERGCVWWEYDRVDELPFKVEIALEFAMTWDTNPRLGTVEHKPSKPILPHPTPRKGKRDIYRK